MTDLLADTGADLSIVPRVIGEALLGDITTGRHLTIGGIVPGATLTCTLHRLQARLNGQIFVLPVAVAHSNATPAILGRADGLDRLTATFVRGRELRLHS